MKKLHNPLYQISLAINPYYTTWITNRSFYQHEAICDWMYYLLASAEQENKFDKALNNLQAAGIAANGMRQEFMEFIYAVPKLSNLIEDLITIHINSIENYKKGNITKLEMAHIFLSSPAEMILRELTNIKSDLSTASRIFKSSISNINVLVTESFYNIFNMTIPVLNITSAANLEIYAYLDENRQFNKADPKSGRMTKEFMELFTEELGDLLAAFKKTVESTVEPAIPALPDMVKTLESIENDLTQYFEESKITAQFFM